MTEDQEMTRRSLIWARLVVARCACMLFHEMLLLCVPRSSYQQKTAISRWVRFLGQNIQTAIAMIATIAAATGTIRASASVVAAQVFEDRHQNHRMGRRR